MICPHTMKPGESKTVTITNASNASLCIFCVSADLRAQLAAMTKERDEAVREMASIREVADPDGEHPEMSTRDCVMHIGEQAALLSSVNRLCKKRGTERDTARAERDAMHHVVNAAIALMEPTPMMTHSLATERRRALAIAVDEYRKAKL